MSETNDPGERKATLSSRGPVHVRRTVEQGRVRQNFSHGRSKPVVVEMKKKRGVGAPGKAAPEPAAPFAVPAAKPAVAHKPAPAAAEAAAPQAAHRPGIVLRTLTEEEKDARERALAGARVREAEDRQRVEEEAKRRADVEQVERRDREAATARAAEEEARHKSDEEAKRKAEEAAARIEKAKPGETGEEEESRTAGRRVKREAKPAPARVKGEPERRRGKLTITKALDEPDDRARSLAAFRRRMERQKKQAQGFQPPTEKIGRGVVIPEAITIQDLANRMAERGVDVMKLLMKEGQMYKITDVIDADTAQIVAEEMGHAVKRVAEADVEGGLMGAEDRADDLQPRAPVVTVMGHVDHGKTSLLDAIRKTNVVAGEAGGITQHIGAYQVEMPGGTVTFIDTPGHAAFTAMRARGAKVTDIVVLVVAADDGVMPQTIEAINHAKAAKVPLIVAINKIDKAGANPQRVRTELMQHEVFVESMGGEVLDVEVSAVKGTNLEKLLEVILLQAEVLELKSNPDRPADGTVIEAKIDRGRGPVATVLIQRGTLRPGDIFVAGSAMGRVRALVDDRGATVREAGASIPVEILGFNSTPEAGDQLVVVESESRAREIALYRERKRREMKGTAPAARASLEQMMNQLKSAGLREFPILVKADVQGSAEAIVQALEKLATEEVATRVIHYGVGGINESDVTLAEAAGAVVFGFNVRANKQARDAAEQTGLEIRYYNIIYDLVDDVKAVMSGMLPPTIREEFLGNAQILEIFAISKVGKVAGCRVVEGVVQRGAKVRLIRDSVVIHEGTLSTLKRFKDEVKEVLAGQECGMAFENYQDMRQGDVIECFRVEQVARTLQ